MKEMENRHLHANGLNDKNSKVTEKGEKELMEERENRHLHAKGLNNKNFEITTERSGNRARTENRFQRRQQMEMENDQDDCGGQWNRSDRNRDEWGNGIQSQPRGRGAEAKFSVGLVLDKSVEHGNRFVRINDLNAANPIRYLEGVLRVCYQDRVSLPNEFGWIRRNPRSEPNPLSCNLQNPEAIQDTKEAVTNILHSMLSKIPEYQHECSAIPEIGSHRITRFDLVETEVIQERIKAILNGSKSGRRSESLEDGEISVYDEGMKDYIQSNRLLDYISEFLQKARKEADRPTQVNGLNETQSLFNGNYETERYDEDCRRAIEYFKHYSYSPSPNSFRISRNRPQNGDEDYYKPSNLSESFNTLPANNQIGVRGHSPSQTIRGHRVRTSHLLSTSLRNQGPEVRMSESMDDRVCSSGKVSRMHEKSTDHLGKHGRLPHSS